MPGPRDMKVTYILAIKELTVLRADIYEPNNGSVLIGVLLTYEQIICQVLLESIKTPCKAMLL